MKRLIVIIGLILCLSSLAFPQQGGRFYGFMAPLGQVRVSNASDNPSMLGFGVGGMYLGSKGFGAGAEIAAVGPRKHTDDSNNWNKQTVGLFTLSGVKAFKLSSEKIEPFASSGWGRTFMRGSGANWWEIGGGVNLWFSEKLGVTVELRDYIRRQDRREWWQYWAPRFGITWRD